jgi:hypothetical protein
MNMNERTIYIYWLITDLFLAVGLLFWPPALFAAMAVTTVHNVHFMMRYPGTGSFPLQVRFTYLGLLLIGQLPYCQWINWVQLIGTTALLTTGYCPLARLLSLAPWNRSQSLSWELFAKALFTPPVNGSILQVVSPE